MPGSIIERAELFADIGAAAELLLYRTRNTPDSIRGAELQRRLQKLLVEGVHGEKRPGGPIAAPRPPVAGHGVEVQGQPGGMGGGQAAQQHPRDAQGVQPLPLIRACKRSSVATSRAWRNISFADVICENNTSVEQASPFIMVCSNRYQRHNR